MAGTEVFSHRLIFQLLELHKERRSGILRAEHGSAKKQLVVRQGRLAFAESNAPEDHLARVMVSMNLLPKSALPGIAAQMKEKKTSDEAILASGKTSQRELEEGAREQALTVLSSLMSWDDGEIRLYSNEHLAQRRFDVALPLPDLIVAAARRAASRRPFPQAFSPLVGPISPVFENRENLLILPLDRIEAFAFSMVTEPSPVEYVISCLVQEHSKPEELILRLLILGLLRKGEFAGEPVQEQPDRSSELEAKLDEMLRDSESNDLYGILGVPADATENQIKQAYHELAKNYHPDRFQSKNFSSSLRLKAQQMFTAITGAYTQLGDKAARSSYDRERLKQKGQSGPAPKARAGAGKDRESMAEIMYRAGQGFFSKGDFERAAEKLRECVYLKPDVAKYQYLLGASQAEVPKMRKEAEQSLLKAIELDRSLAEPYVALAKLYLKVGMARRAEAQIREALRLSPGNSEAGELLKQITSRDA